MVTGTEDRENYRFSFEGNYYRLIRIENPDWVYAEHLDGDKVGSERKFSYAEVKSVIPDWVVTAKADVDEPEDNPPKPALKVGDDLAEKPFVVKPATKSSKR